MNATDNTSDAATTELMPRRNEMHLVDDPPRYNLTPEGGNVVDIGTNPYLALLDKALANNAAMEVIERMMALQITWDDREQRKAFVAAMARFKRRELTILKAKRVAFPTNQTDSQGNTVWTEYSHAELADVANVVVPALAAEGISHRWDVKQEGGQITVTCTLTHEMGHSESVSMTAAPDNSGKKNLIQQVASTNTYLQRYTLLAITGLATQGQDDDGRLSGETVGEQLDGADGQQPGGSRVRASQSPEELAKRKAQHDEALGRHSESVAFIKNRLAADDLVAAAAEWRAIDEADQRALWLAPTKGGCFTTAERKTLHDKLPPRPGTQTTNHSEEE